MGCYREEQADEYSSLRKNLEQSNKNCRILSFKLRKVERRTEQLEMEKVDLEKKYDQVLQIMTIYILFIPLYDLCFHKECRM